MRVPLLLCSVCAVICVPVGGQEVPVPTGAVAGSVSCLDSQTPCRFAGVTIEAAPSKDNARQSAAKRIQSYSGTTDISGSFRIDHVVPGDYYILPRLAGYLSPYDIAANEYRERGQENHIPREILDAALTRITVTAGQTTSVSLPLARGASLAGRVQYDDGAPGIHLPVHLYREESDGTWREYYNLSGDSPLAPLGLGPHTDDRGRYYEPGLPPGNYKVETTLPTSTFAATSITGRTALDATITNGNALQVFNGRTYRLKDAPAIELHSGEDRPDIDLTVPTDGLRTVSGIVIAGPNQQAITNGTVRLLDPRDKSVLRETNLRRDGSFAFEYVTDGSYLVQIEANGPHLAITAPLLVTSDVMDLSYSLPSTLR